MIDKYQTSGKNEENKQKKAPSQIRTRVDRIESKASSTMLSRLDFSQNHFEVIRQQ